MIHPVLFYTYTGDHGYLQILLIDYLCKSIATCRNATFKHKVIYRGIDPYRSVDISLFQKCKAVKFKIRPVCAN